MGVRPPVRPCSPRSERLTTALDSDLLPQNPGKYQGRYDGGIRLNNKFRRVDIQLAPGYLFIRHRARVRTIRGGGIGYLAKITPERDFGHLHILVKHRHYAYREIAGNTTADLEKADPFAR